ncbi:hypothetical protein D7Y15_37825 [Corallococcus sp. AB030]|nr:hypothetical protein D7Y15_37825 [Corallococcus sp. AB030]
MRGQRRSDDGTRQPVYCLSDVLRTAPTEKHGKRRPSLTLAAPGNPAEFAGLVTAAATRWRTAPPPSRPLGH